MEACPPLPLLILLLLLPGSAPFNTDDSCSRGCHCLPEPPGRPETVSCPGLNLQVIPQDLPPTLKRLSLGQNRILSVDTTLAHYSRLTHLDLAKNRVAQVERGSFRYSASLAFLDLSDNQLSYLPEDAFLGLGTLKEISLANNNIESLPGDLFENCNQLEIVYLSGNRLTSLPAKLFSYVQHLQTLDLSGNLFIRVPSPSFPPISHLSRLDLSGNSLERLQPDDFWPLGKLRHLVLSGCRLKAIPRALFKKQVHLESLDLSNNELASVPSQAFLSLGSSLKTLYLGLNYLEGLDETSFSGLGSLVNLVMRGCRHGMGLQVSPAAFANNLNLETVNVTKCPGLKKLPSGLLSHLPKVKTVNFHDNGLKSVPEDLLDWQEVESVELSGNPFHCDCSLQWLNSLLMNTAWSNGDPSPATCQYPKKLHGQILGTIPKHKMSCGEKSDGQDTNQSKALTVALSIIGSLCFLAAVGVAFYCILRRRRQKQLHLKGVHIQKRKLLSRPPSWASSTSASSSKAALRKKDIQVVPTEVKDSARFMDIVKAMSEENLYEELAPLPEAAEAALEAAESAREAAEAVREAERPVGPPGVVYPDVKTSEL